MRLWKGKSLQVNAGDIINVNLDPTAGGEKGKTRPCLVLVGSGHPWNIIIIVPITEVDGGFRPAKLFVNVPSNPEAGLTKPSAIDCFQIRCLSEKRIKGKILGIVPSGILEDVRSRVAAILDIGEEHVT